MPEGIGAVTATVATSHMQQACTATNSADKATSASSTVAAAREAICSRPIPLLLGWPRRLALHQVLEYAQKMRVPLPPAALRRRSCEADHSLRARLERTAVSTCSMDKRSSSVVVSLTQVASKVAMMKGSEAACRSPALQLLCLREGCRQRRAPRFLIWGHASRSTSKSF